VVKDIDGIGIVFFDDVTSCGIGWCSRFVKAYDAFSASGSHE
jgi:hypothetical protein